MSRIRNLRTTLAVAGAIFASGFIAAPVAAEPDPPCLRDVWRYCGSQGYPVGSPAWDQCVEDNYYMFCPFQRSSVTRQDMAALLAIRED